MSRPANPNKEKIAALKAEMKEHAKTVRQGESAAKKLEKMEDKLAKLSGDAPVKKSKKEAAPEKKAKKTAKATAKEEKKKTKVVVNKKRGRPKKVVDDEDED